MLAATVDTVMRSLADPTRRAVFEKIVQSGEMPAGALTQGLAVSQPAISQHLRALKEAGLVAERREGRNIYYRPEPRGLTPLVDWLGMYGAFWRERFANLHQLLKEIDHDGHENGDTRHRRRKRPASRS